MRPWKLSSRAMASIIAWPATTTATVQTPRLLQEVLTLVSSGRISIWPMQLHVSRHCPETSSGTYLTLTSMLFYGFHEPSLVNADVVVQCADTLSL